jgi:hypothetical protein
MAGCIYTRPDVVGIEWPCDMARDLHFVVITLQRDHHCPTLTTSFDIFPTSSPSTFQFLLDNIGDPHIHLCHFARYDNLVHHQHPVAFARSHPRASDEHCHGLCDSRITRTERETFLKNIHMPATLLRVEVFVDDIWPAYFRGPSNPGGNRTRASNVGRFQGMDRSRLRCMSIPTTHHHNTSQ